MNEFESWHNDVIGERTVAALKKNRFMATYCKTGQEAVKKILEQIPESASVGIGGSWTVMQLGLLDKLATRGNEVLNHGKTGLTPEEARAIRRRQLTSVVSQSNIDNKISFGSTTKTPSLLSW